MILNGYIPTLQTEGAVAYFFRDVCHKPIVSPVLFKQMTDRFVAAVQAFAQSHAIPVLHVGQGQKPGDLGQPALARAEREGRWGVVAIVVHQESARAFSSYRPWENELENGTGINEKTDVSLGGSLADFNRGGYTREYQNTVVAPDCQSHAAALAASLPAR